MKKKKYIQHRGKRFLAMAMSVAMAGSLVDVAMFPTQKVEAAKEGIEEGFETDTLQGTFMGDKNYEFSKDAHTGEQALFVTNRSADWNCYSYDVSKYAGKTIKLDAFMKVESDNLLAVACVKGKNDTDGEYYKWATCTATKDGEWVKLSSDYKVPEGADCMYFMTWDNEAQKGTVDSYLLDDVSIQETCVLEEDFNDCGSVDNIKGYAFGGPTLTLVEVEDGNKALQVSGRNENYFSYAISVAAFAGNKISVSADLSAYESENDVEHTFAGTLKTTKAGEDDGYNQVASGTSVGKETVTITGEYEVPAGCDSYDIYFETDKEVNYRIDNIKISVVGAYNKEEHTYVDISEYQVLKDLYKDDFKMGVASEALSHWGGSNPLNEIGNPYKEALIKKEFNSLTFGNELKPDYNMGYNSEDATETYLPFVIDTSAEEMLQWAKENGIPVRGHTLVWHSQCPDAVFCKGYKPVYTDDKKTVLDENCLVDSETMLARLESYIDNVMKYMYEHGYGDVIYCWDVVNEAVEPGAPGTTWNLRNSYWYRTIGEDFMYYAFKYARDYSVKYSKEYADLYDVSKDDEQALKGIQPKLFYNDYNEFQEVKKNAIIDVLTKEVNGHSIKADGYIDGIGMQSHLTDTTNIETFMQALRDYEKAFGEVHITELDVAQTSTGVNADYYQAAFYKKLFEELLKAREEKVNLSCVTIWGLTDDNSWKKESSPLLFKSDLSAKMAFDGIVYAKTGDSLPEPAYVAPDFTDGNYEFDAEDATAESEGFTPRGDSKLGIQKDETFSGNGALLVTGRGATWHGASFDVSRFVGQTISISAWVKSKSPEVKISADIDNEWPNITKADTSSGEWVQIKGTYKVPAELTALKLYFETSDMEDIYVDHLQVKLVGMEEDFEGKTNIASPRGVGHMPRIAVTDAEKLTGTKSLLVTREAQDASVKFDVSKYIGQTITVKAHVKTNDTKIRLGLDGDNPLQLAEVNAKSGVFTEVQATYTISNKLTSANMYLETNGNADFYVDDITVNIADYTDDVEGEELKFDTRWGGAGTIERIEDGVGNHVVRLTDKDETYYGVCFDVSPYLGMQVEISCDVKTDDAIIGITGDIADKWPNYLKTKSEPGKYKTVRTVVTLPKDLTALKLYIESDGKSDIYVDNLSIKRVPIGTEYKVDFDTNGKVDEPATQVITKGYLVTQPDANSMVCDGYTFTGWYKDEACTVEWDFTSDRVTDTTTIYAGWEKVDPSVEPSVSPSVSPSVEPSVAPSTTPGVGENDDTYKVTLDVTKPFGTLGKILDAKKQLEAGKDVTVEFIGVNGDVIYSWTLKADCYSKKIDLKDINISISISSSKGTGFKNGMYVKMGHKKKLPMQSELKIKAGSYLKAGSKAYLYQYDAKTKKLNCVPNSNYKVDKNGYVTLKVITGKDYVLLPAVAPASKKSGVFSQVDYTDKVSVKKGTKKSVAIKLPDTIKKVSSLEKFDQAKYKSVYGAKVTYKSSKQSVATVNSDGVITAKGKGTTSVIATVQLSNKKTKTYKTTITVK